MITSCTLQASSTLLLTYATGRLTAVNAMDHLIDGGISLNILKPKRVKQATRH